MEANMCQAEMPVQKGRKSMLDWILLTLVVITIGALLIAQLGEITEHLTVALVGLTVMVTGMTLFGGVLTVDTLAALIKCPPATPDTCINIRLWASEIGLAIVGLLTAIGGISQIPNIVRCWTM